jgi:hypothetical protein
LIEKQRQRVDGLGDRKTELRQYIRGDCALDGENEIKLKEWMELMMEEALIYIKNDHRMLKK